MQHAILIADDDRELVSALAIRCRHRGLNVLCAYDAFSALSIVKAESLNVICLDVEMPAGNGLSVCEMVVTDESCRSIPVVIMTGKCDPDTIIRCHNMCAYYVEKCPDVWSRLEPLLEELLTLPRDLDLDPSSGSTPGVALTRYLQFRTGRDV